MYEEAVNTIEDHGFTAKLYPDFDAENPLGMRDTLTTYVFESRDYDFGDKHLDIYTATGYDADDFENRADGEPRNVSPDALAERFLRMDQNILAFTPIHFADYGSSGAQIYESSSYAGSGGVVEFACVTRDDYEMMEGKGSADAPEARENARRYMLAEMEEFNQYLQSDVYGYVIEDQNGETVDSCWRFYGRDYALEEMKSMLAEAVKETKTRAWVQVAIEEASLRG